ncbi:MAG: tetraacyldisaccharide 4'-kinase [Thermodesulfobacteriota bacterium]
MDRISWSRLHEKRQWNLISLFLGFCSLIYSAGVRLRLMAYRKGLLKAKSLPAFVVSVGNITAGGTGKTPFVAMLGDWASRREYSTAILSLGYKRKKSGRESVVVSDGKGNISSVYDAGDEPILLARKLPSTPVLISKDRYAIGEMAIRRFASELLLLDDGYQYLALKRDLNVLLIDTKRQFGNTSLLPLGPLREPFEGIKRADLIVLTRCSNNYREDELKEFLNKIVPTKPVVHSRHLPDKLLFPRTGEAHPPQILQEKHVMAFAGIANTDDFLEMITGLGAHVVGFKEYPDHYAYGASDFEELASWSKRSEVDFLLTTEKDWVRIDETVGAHLNIGVLAITMELLEGDRGLFDIIEWGIQRSKVITNDGKSKKRDLTAGSAQDCSEIS